MPSRGKSPRPTWSLGFQEYKDAGFNRFQNRESGATIEEIMEWFDVTREQVTAVLEFAARSLDAPTLDREPVDAHPV